MRGGRLDGCWIQGDSLVGRGRGKGGMGATYLGAYACEESEKKAEKEYGG